MPENAKRMVPGSSWGTFTIACTIPIALFIGWYMNHFRKGKILEASLLGAAAVLAATVGGAFVPGSHARALLLSVARTRPSSRSAAYGFVAAVLPVWLLLAPRDYLSTFLKIGTILLLVAGVIVANPKLHAPPVSPYFAAGGGPYFDGPIFPYVFICIMCGAISGFHALVSSGTTPKMIDRESDVRMIGYGAMLMEGLVGVVALIAAAALPNAMYYDINIDLARRPDFLAKHRDFAQFIQAGEVDMHGGHAAGAEGGSELVAMERDVQESLHGRTGGAVTLAVGMARIFSDGHSGHELADQVLVSFRDHVRGALHPDHDRRRHADRAVPGPGVSGQDLEAAGRPQLAAGVAAGDGAGRLWLGLFHLYRQRRDDLADVRHGQPVAGGDRPGGGDDRARQLGTRALCADHRCCRCCSWRRRPRRPPIYEISGKFRNMIKLGEVVRGWLNIGLTVVLLACVVVIVAQAVCQWIGRARSQVASP